MQYTKEFEKAFNEIFAKNLRYYMDAMDVSQNELAQILNVSPTSVNNWYNGYKTPRMDKVDKICKYFNIARSDLMEDKDEKSNPWQDNLTTLDSEPTVKIPVCGVIPAGAPIEAIEDIEEFIEIPAKWTVGDQKYIGLKVKGDSMSPKYMPGDTVVIRIQPDCDSGQDCAVYVNGYEATLKKVIKERDGIMLQPLNPEYNPKKYDYNDENEPVSILGVVVELRRKI